MPVRSPDARGIGRIKTDIPASEAEILNGTSGFNRLQNNDDRMLSESGFTHGDLLGNTTSMSEEL
jgi:hypothetical protein